MEGPHKQPDKTNIVWVTAFTLMGGAVVLASFIALQAMYLGDANKLEFKRELQGKRAQVEALSAKQQLDEYRRTEDGRVQIPVERAMELIVEDVRAMGSDNLVPAVGSHTVPSIPAEFGKPPANAMLPPPDDGAAVPGDGTAAPADGAAAPTDGAAAPADGAAAPADGAAAPADGAAAPAGGATAPAGGAAAPADPATPPAATPPAATPPAAPAGGNAPQ